MTQRTRAARPRPPVANAFDAEPWNGMDDIKHRFGAKVTLGAVSIGCAVGRRTSDLTTFCQNIKVRYVSRNSLGLLASSTMHTTS